MEVSLSQRVQSIKPSPTLAVTNRAAELRASGLDIIGLGAGEPDFDTPEHIKEAAIKAIQNGQTKYTAVDGTPALKNAIIEKFRRENGFEFAANEILVSSGGKQSFFNLSLALLDPEDEVIIPAPYWVSYPDMVRITGAVPVIIEGSAEQRFKISAKQLEQAITPKTKLMVINSPSNPSGMSYSEEELGEIAKVLVQHPNILIATDDMYEHIQWTGKPFKNILNVCPELKERCIVLNGVSKAYAMTGWRIGYAAGPAKLIAAMKKIQSQSTSNPASISQAAALAALESGTEFVTPMVKAFKERHDYVVQRLNDMPNVSCLAADGTFYVFPDFSQVIESRDDITDDVDLAEFLINKANVAVVPGSAFGSPGHVRLSFATSLETLQEALDRIQKAVK
ncbi:MAG: aspartate aminotransferase [Moraxellaceae bacterium]|nr:MAG: aspartate aminotransferase [Moraxellaceae bacterium]